MKEQYELHCNGQVTEDSDFATLKRAIENTTIPYEIYVIKQSKMNTQKGRKLRDEQIEMAIRMIGKGRSKKDVATMLHVCASNLNRSIRAYDKDYNLRPTKL